ncbi:MAG: transporter [Rhodobacteraceae bacterium]|nr:transporter [Paracoccaceae bacterium]
MDAVLHHLLGVVVPIAICVLVGFSLARLEIPFDRKMVGKLVQTVGYPTLIVSHLSAGHVDLPAFLAMLGAAFAMVAAFLLISALLLTLLGLPLRVFLSPMSLNNVGNVGLPVASLAFGAAGLSYSLAFVVAVLLGIFTYGSWIPKGSVSFREVATSPVIYAIVIALALLACGTALPTPVGDALGILAGLAIPLMLLTLGHSLATLQVGAFARGALLAILHLVMALGIGFGLSTAFHFTGTERGVFILMSVMPVSVATYLFVELYAPDRAPEVASLILVSTILTVVVLPLVLAYGV